MQTTEHSVRQGSRNNSAVRIGRIAQHVCQAPDWQALEVDADVLKANRSAFNLKNKGPSVPPGPVIDLLASIDQVVTEPEGPAAVAQQVLPGPLKDPRYASRMDLLKDVLKAQGIGVLHLMWQQFHPGKMFVSHRAVWNGPSPNPD